ncbi:hypothetical protein XENTR_v10015542 [Xenopus tropicalis]|nr:hypothetical protein XENTR_v10015542 [Xenopus tropicalis]
MRIHRKAKLLIGQIVQFPPLLQTDPWRLPYPGAMCPVSVGGTAGMFPALMQLPGSHSDYSCSGNILMDPRT